jgi:hypothetical protein
MTVAPTPLELVPNTANQSGLTRAITEALQSLYKTSTSDPTTSEDIDSGYQINSIWVNTSDNGIFLCVDNSAGAAVWTELGVAASTPILEVVATVDLSSVTTITHTFAAGYDYWLKIAQAVPTDDNVNAFFRMNGSSGATEYSWRVVRNATTEADISDSEIQLSGGGNMGASANEEFGPMQINFGEMSSTSLYKRISWFGGYTASNSAEQAVQGHGMWQSASAVTSISLTTGGASDWDSGVMTLYRSSRT